MAEGEEELKGLLMNVKKKNEKAGLKFNFQKVIWKPQNNVCLCFHFSLFTMHKVMVPQLVPSNHQICEVSQITADSDCSC